MSSLTAGAHFRWIVEEEEERRAREEGTIRGNCKKVHWNSSVQVRSISPRRLKVGGGMGPPPGSRPPAGLFSGSKKLEEHNNQESKEKAKTLVTLRMLSQSTKALVGQAQSKESFL